MNDVVLTKSQPQRIATNIVADKKMNSSNLGQQKHPEHIGLDYPCRQHFGQRSILVCGPHHLGLILSTTDTFGASTTATLLSVTIDLFSIKHHYYASHPQINPTEIVPAGADPNLTAPKVV